MPEGIKVALLILTTTEDEAAVKEYQTSSSTCDAMAQEGTKNEGVALAVVAATDELQLIPNGVGAMAMAPEHSSLAGWAIITVEYRQNNAVLKKLEYLRMAVHFDDFLETILSIHRTRTIEINVYNESSHTPRG